MVDLCRRRSGFDPERVIAGDLVSVAIRRHGACVLSPLRRRALVDWLVADSLDPSVLFGESNIEDRVSALLDQRLAFREGLSHLVAHPPACLRDEPGEEPRRAPRATRVGGLAGRTGEAVVQDRCDVVGILEAAGRNQARHERVKVVTFGFRAPQLGSKCSERVGGKHIIDLIGGEAAVLNQGRPAVALCGGRDGLVLGGELRDRPPTAPVLW